MRDRLYYVSRWLLSVAILLLAVYLFYSQIYLVYGPKVGNVDARLPTFLHRSPAVFWSWLLGSGAAGGLVGYWTLRTWRLLRRGPDVEDDDRNEAEAALEAAGAAIADLRLGHEGDPAFLLVAEGTGEGPIGLLTAAGMAPDAVAAEELAPIRGFRTAEGLFLQCSGPDTRGAQFLARLLPRLPGAPTPRGVVVLVPADRLLGPQGRGLGVAARAVLRALAEATPTRCPAYVVVTGMEDVPGFLEFARRTPAEYRNSVRLGFSLPGGPDPTPAAVAREYDRLVAWCQPSILDMMEADPLEQAGNEALFGLGRWFLRAREPMLQFLDAARAGGDDPIELLNCYFAATGEAPDRRAFAESVVRAKVAGDPHAARWSDRMLAEDRRLGRMAIGLGALGGVAAALAWALIFRNLRPTGWSEVALAGAIAVGWGLTWYELIRGLPRGKRRPA